MLQRVVVDFCDDNKITCCQISKRKHAQKAIVNMPFKFLRSLNVRSVIIYRSKLSKEERTMKTRLSTNIDGLLMQFFGDAGLTLNC